MCITFIPRSFPATLLNLKAMKKYTHAWLAMMVPKRLHHAVINPIEWTAADILLRWLSNHRDSVIKGAWYPDANTCDTDTNHGLKYFPVGSCTTFRIFLDNYPLRQICGMQIPN
jgi:hypothetical protein